MLWIGLVVALGLLVGALIVTFGYRHSLMAVTALVAVAIAALVWHIRFGDPAGSGLIDPEELALNNLALSRQYRSSYGMTGRLVNGSSEYTLHSVTIKITASDCAEGGSDCIVVGEAERTLPVEVPPGQARDIADQYVFPRFEIQGELRWRHSFSEIEASKR